MNEPCSTAMLLALLFLSRAHAAEPNAQDILDHLQQHIQEYRSSLPDFMCNEKVTSTKLSSGKAGETTVTESVFEVRPRASRSTGTSLVETREIRAVNGKPSHAKKMKGPFRFNGGIVDALAVFDGNAANCRQFEARADKDSSAVRLVFVARPNQLGLGAPCSDGMTGESGELLVERGTLEPVRLIDRIPNASKDGKFKLTVTIDFSPLHLGNSDYRMPERIEARLDGSEGSASYDYVAEYSEYRKFASSSRINYQDP